MRFMPTFGLRLDLPDGGFYLAIVTGFTDMILAKEAAIQATGWLPGASEPVVEVEGHRTMRFRKNTHAPHVAGFVTYVLEPAWSPAVIDPG